MSMWVVFAISLNAMVGYFRRAVTAFKDAKGMFRNDWYKLIVNSVSGPGEPDIPEVDDDDPADEQNQYINCDINILSWAVREQEIDL